MEGTPLAGGAIPTHSSWMTTNQHFSGRRRARAQRRIRASASRGSCRRRRHRWMVLLRARSSAGAPCTHQTCPSLLNGADALRWCNDCDAMFVLIVFPGCSCVRFRMTLQCPRNVCLMSLRSMSDSRTRRPVHECPDADQLVAGSVPERDYLPRFRNRISGSDDLLAGSMDARGVLYEFIDEDVLDKPICCHFIVE